MKSNQVLKKLLEKQWAIYKERVSYAAKYADFVEGSGGKVVNDHIAYRSFNCDLNGGQPSGLQSTREILEALGYEKKESYQFKIKKLNAMHFEHKDDPTFPKMFVSQLEVNELDNKVSALIEGAVKSCRTVLTEKSRDLLAQLKRGGSIDNQQTESLTDNLVDYFTRPWNVVSEEVLQEVNEHSQYAAWTLLHGNSVNHFTAFINEHKVEQWSDIEKTVDGMKELGVPMKNHIEGGKGSKLRQSSTKAIIEKVPVLDSQGKEKLIDWTYAFYELAERGMVEQDGKQVEFRGFLGEQATHLFEMTKKE